MADEQTFADKLLAGLNHIAPMPLRRIDTGMVVQPKYAITRAQLQELLVEIIKLRQLSSLNSASE